MTDVAITLNGRTYQLRAGPGEETRLVALAERVRDRFDTLKSEHGQVGDDRLLLMVAITFVDALADAEQAAAALEARVKSAEAALTRQQTATERAAKKASS